MTGKWDSVLRLDKNSKGRDFVCGDIHGCFSDLESELKKVHFDESKDRLFTVGDIIDRGPNSELATRYMSSDWFFSVMGNHEHMYLMANINTPQQESYLQDHLHNGGRWAYEMPAENSRAMLLAIDKLPLIIQVGDVIIAHAVLPEVENLEEIENDPIEHVDTVVWYRGEYPPVNIQGINKIYVGHSIVEEPEQSGKYHNIDTGAFKKHWGKTGKLTILEL